MPSNRNDRSAMAEWLAFTGLIGWSWAAIGAQTTGVTLGDCSPVVGSNTGVINIICGPGAMELKKWLENLPQIRDYNKQAEALQTLLGNVNRLIQELARLGNETKASEGKIQDVKRQLKEVKDTQAKLIEQQPTVARCGAEAMLAIDKLLKADNLRQDELLYELRSKTCVDVEAPSRNPEKDPQARTEKEKEAFKQHLAEITNASENLFFEVNKGLEGLDLRVSDVEKKLIELEDAQREAQNAIKELNDKVEKKIRPSNGFMGIALGGARAEGDWVTWFTLEYEWLAPKIEMLQQNDSIFTEVGYFNWNKASDVPTLPGAPSQTITEDNRFWFAGIGTRRYFPFAEETRWAGLVGLVGGSSFLGVENTAYLAVLSGVEYFRQSARVLVELRYQWLSNISQQDMQFNPFGPAQIEETKADTSVVSLNVRVSF